MCLGGNRVCRSLVARSETRALTLRQFYDRYYTLVGYLYPIKCACFALDEATAQEPVCVVNFGTEEKGHFGIVGPEITFQQRAKLRRRVTMKNDGIPLIGHVMRSNVLLCGGPALTFEWA